MTHASERTHALDRWLHRGKRPNRLALTINGAWARLAAAGIGPARLVMLEVYRAAPGHDDLLSRRRRELPG